jgi:hypothetical protein
VLSVAPLIGAYLSAGGLIGQVPLPGTSSVSVPLSPPNACGRCHRPVDEADLGGIYDTWAGSVMGHAARDPVFLAALTVAESDAPGVGDFCLRCHAPEAWLEGRCIETNGEQLDANDSGVTCSVCHRMEPTPYVKNAQYIVADDSVMRGPYDQSVAPHRNAQSAWISDPQLCGTCHDLYNPLVHRRTLTGTLTSALFPEQTTYSEWAQSAFAREGKDCKSCHLPESEGQIADTGPIRMDRSDHGIAGVNNFLLDAIDFLYPELDLSTRLAIGRAKNEAMLRRAATVEVIDGPSMVRRGDPYTIRVKVTNEAGHKLPTGYPLGRRVFLSARTSSAAPLVDDVGEPVDPIALYEIVQGQFGIGPGHHLALNDIILSDTRIPARGMIVTATIAPVGKVYPQLEPGVLVHWDEVEYTATAPCDPLETEAAIEIGLYHQVLTRSYSDALIAANTGLPRGDRLSQAVEAIDPKPVEMAREIFRATLDPSSSCAPPDAGFPDSGAPDAAPITDAGTLDRDADVPVDAGLAVEGGCSCTGARTPDGSEASALIMLLAMGLGLGRFGRKRR